MPEYDVVIPDPEKIELFEEIKNIVIAYHSTSVFNIVRRRQLINTFIDLAMIWFERDYVWYHNDEHYRLEIQTKSSASKKLISGQLVYKSYTKFEILRGDILMEMTLTIPVRKSKDENNDQ